ncbi:diguanylate cyclase [Marinobacter halodurans]|uniref:diguanylate cyclase n=1 Tax=Marinobacter halodurans TaxID=2528979 RepID=A0ABY1ZMJ3_9GAMM|nr:diguanylate cyclase [Marinobacter halodurans]TBW55435.1 diguanylate cyclase [Marinobacter halodurans]
MHFSRFSLKVVILSILPLGLFATALLVIQLHEASQLTESATRISDVKIQEIYRSHVRNQARSIAGQVRLRLESIRNELNILRGSAQLLIDRPSLAGLGAKVNQVDFFHNHLIYNDKQHWANLAQSDDDISMSVWGYLLGSDGRMNEATRRHVALVSGIKPLLFSIGHYGMPKGWLYVVGPKTTPVMTMTPWAQMPAIFDKEYPGHNTHNWWDMFFPGIVEGWTSWLPKLPDPESQVTLTPLYKDAGGTGLMVTFFAPLWNADRTANAGAAAVDYPLNNLVNLVKKGQISHQGFSFIMDSSGGNILGLKPEWAKTLGLSEKKRTDSGVTQSYFKLSDSKNDKLRQVAGELEGDDLPLHTFTDAQGQPYLLAFKKITAFNRWNGHGPGINRDTLYLGTTVPLTEVKEVRDAIKTEISTISERSQHFMVLSALGVALLVAGLATLFAWRQTRQIRLLNECVDAVRNKDFTGQVEVAAKDDLGDLARAFNKMVMELNESHQQASHYSRALEDKVRERTRELEEKNAALEQLSVTDALTGLYNRHKLDQVLIYEQNRFQRYGHIFSVILLDIDHFKLVNDLHGHSIGDDVLKQVADILAWNTRQTDSVGRWGGEEFLIVCTDTDLDGAATLSNLLRQRIASHDFPHLEGITASFGVTEYRAGDNESLVVSRADDALYQAKHAGRNKVFGL